jgi:hypothetical protein
VLDIKKFYALEKSTATRYLGLSLMRSSGRIYKPRLKKLERIYQLILDGKLLKEDFYGCALKKLNDEKIIISDATKL